MPLIRLKDGPKFLPYSLPAIRDIYFKSKDRVNSRGEVTPGNGYAAAFLKDGERVLLDTERYLAILYEKNGRPYTDDDHLGIAMNKVLDQTRPSDMGCMVRERTEPFPSQDASYPPKGDNKAQAVIWTPERRDQLRREHNALVSSGQKAPTRVLAEKYGISETRIRVLKAAGREAADVGGSRCTDLIRPRKTQ